PRSKTVVLYFHGGAHAFCSPRSHRHMLSQIAKDIGPGTRVFSVDYRLAPENPFPAAIHDAFAAYLYLTEPEHAALVLDEGSAVHELAVDPRDIVVAGDSAGGNLAAAFM
ncbi:lipase, partial [Dissophora ornata]